MMRQRGQVALETIMVIGLWLFIVFFFLNIMFLLSSAILAQTGVNRLAIQVGALGCQPGATEEDIRIYAEEEIGGLGTEIQNVDLYTWRAGDSLVFDEDDATFDVIDPDSGRPDTSLPEVDQLPLCSDPSTGRPTRLGDFIFVGVRYNQSIAFPSMFGLDPGGKIDVYRSATITSSRIEGGAR